MIINTKEFKKTINYFEVINPDMKVTIFFKDGVCILKQLETSISESESELFNIEYILTAKNINNLYISFNIKDIKEFLKNCKNDEIKISMVLDGISKKIKFDYGLEHIFIEPINFGTIITNFDYLFLKYSVKILQQDIKDIINAFDFSGTEATKPELQGVLLQIFKNTLRIVASDSNTVYLNELTVNSNLSYTGFLNLKLKPILKGFLKLISADNDIKMYWEKQHILIFTNKAMIKLNFTNIQFPDYNYGVNKIREFKTIFSKDDFLEKLLILQKENITKRDFCNIEFENDNIFLSLDDIKEKKYIITNKYNDNNAKIKLNLKNLIKIFKNLDFGDVWIKYSNFNTHEIFKISNNKHLEPKVFFICGRV